MIRYVTSQEPLAIDWYAFRRVDMNIGSRLCGSITYEYPDNKEQPLLGGVMLSTA